METLNHIDLSPSIDVRNRIRKIISQILLFLPIPIVGLVVTTYYLGDYTKSLVILALLIPTIFCYLAIKKGYLRFPVLLMALVLNAVVTWSCVMGNGIHDLGIIVYPFIILFTSLLLRNKDLIFISILTAACICFLVIGHRMGVFVSQLPGTGREADFVILTLVLATGLYTTSSLTRVIKKAIKDTEEEIATQARHKATIEESILISTDRLRQVHHRVKNHLSLINSILEIKSQNGQELKTHQEIKNQVIALARIHDRLFQGDDYEQVDIVDYLPGVAENFSKSYGHEVAFSSDQKEIIIPTNKAILLALFLHELITVLGQESEDRIDFFLQKNEQLTLTTHLTGTDEMLSDTVKNRLSYLTHQLNGELTTQSEAENLRLRLVFSPT